MKTPSSRKRQGFLTVDASSIRYQEGGAATITCQVVEEDVLTIDVEGIGSYLLMWTPTESSNGRNRYRRGVALPAGERYPEALALAAGFCFTEGLISGREDILSLEQYLDAPGVVRVQLVNPASATPNRRNVVVASSCGICGGREAVENSTHSLSRVSNSLQIESRRLNELMAAMRRRQSVFDHTGGAHAAGIFDAEGRLSEVTEDLGRHNALDKLIGRQLLEGRPCSDSGVLLTSRLSFEMVVKAARAGFQLIGAVSAPTSLAIEIADRVGMTLCGFVRDDRATVFTHPQRVRTKEQAAPLGADNATATPDEAKSPRPVTPPAN